MRINRLIAQNFKRFKEQEFNFQDQFTLLVGENGSGKTSVLDALAIAAGIWLVNPPDSTLNSSRRSILPNEINLEANQEGGRIRFKASSLVVIGATGEIGGHSDISWKRKIKPGARINDTEAKEALSIIQELYAKDYARENVLFPVIAYYGAGRAWLPSNETIPKPKLSGPARRWAAFLNCFNERINFAKLQEWINLESAARGNREGRWRPGFEAVRVAVLNCVPEAEDIWFDADLDQIVLSIAGRAQPIGNLSAGQRAVLALVVDLAIKTVTQNAFLLPPDKLESIDEPIPRVLYKTPGLVLIDELDAHLCPSWQQHVVTNLKNTFQSIQFVCTSHSPQMISGLLREEILRIGL